MHGDQPVSLNLTEKSLTDNKLNRNERTANIST